MGTTIVLFVRHFILTDIYRVGHYFVFLIVGYLAPKHIKLIVIMGITWNILDIIADIVGATGIYIAKL